MSSERAAKAAREQETLWSAVPLIGSVIGQLRGNSVAKSIDKVYDEVRHNTKIAQESV